MTTFITASQGEQRAQFILVNSTKPLPKGLIYELLPTTKGPPPALMREALPRPARGAAQLRRGLPYHGIIHTPTTPDGIVKDNSILRMLENSLSDGCLYHYHDADTGGGDIEEMLLVLKPFWHAVEKVFGEAWIAARRSRLMHGVGIASIGYLMDAITDEYIAHGTWPDESDYAAELKLAPRRLRVDDRLLESGSRLTPALERTAEHSQGRPAPQRSPPPRVQAPRGRPSSPRGSAVTEIADRCSHHPPLPAHPLRRVVDRGHTISSEGFDSHPSSGGAACRALQQQAEEREVSVNFLVARAVAHYLKALRPADPLRTVEEPPRMVSQQSFS